jgi:uncharacterized protein (TIGR02147 family)
MLSVFNYLDFRLFIADAQKEIKAKKPFFTYRYIAQKVGMKSPGHITWIIQGKRNLSKKKIPLFARVFGLNAKETEFFTMLVLFCQAKTHVDKKFFLDKLVAHQGPEKQLIQPASYEFYNKWYYPIVRELVAIHKLGDDFKRISRLVSPAITPREAQQAIALLTKLDLIRKNAQGQYEQVKQAITTGETWRSIGIRQFQMDTFDLAKKALNTVPPEERDLSTLTMSISRERFQMIKERISAFRNELVSLITSDPEPTSVYEMNIALFPLSKKEVRQ